MNTMLITTPLRPVPTPYPPMGSLSIIKYLRKHGNNIEFYNIDSLRPSYEDALAYIVAANPTVLGISAVVSTSYAYTKKLSLDVKKILPETLIVVGGNLAASAEILLRRTGADICVLGEGEKTFLKVVERAEQTRTTTDFANIPGLALLDGSNDIVNTGYETPLSNEDIYDVDWSDLTETSDIDHYIFDPFESGQALEWLEHDARAHQSHRIGKTIVEMHTSKGCVARCTFCHRFEKGVRYIPVEVLGERIETLIEDYNLGFLVIADENFGTDRRWLKRFCEMIKPFDLLWRVAGMRVNCISPEYIEMMKGAGCVSIIYGMETGSKSMLQIMEKKTKVEQNRDAIKWTIDAGLYSIIQLVIGMPGENPNTISETVEFTKFGLTLDAAQNPNNLSVNYAQALPGTPLYEFGRHKGLIACDLDGEEEYLLRISDSDAHDEITTLNFTEFPALECQTWRPLVTVETNYAYVQKYGLKHYHGVLLNDSAFFKTAKRATGRFANPRRLIDTSIATDSIHGTKEAYEISKDINQPPYLWSLIKQGKFGLAMICYPVLFYRLRRALPFIVLLKNILKFPLSYNLGTLFQYIRFKLRLGLSGMPFEHEYKSLRKIVHQDFNSISTDNIAMQSLRRGR